jgi:membrane-bound lytic murein transglycosylase A
MRRIVARRSAGALAVAVGAALIASCATPPPYEGPAPVESRSPSGPATPAPATPLPGGTLLRAKARWVPVEFAELPGWGADRTQELWPAFVRGCDKPAPGWESVCAAAVRAPVPRSDGEARAWLEQRLRAYRVESPDGRSEGLVTGYFEPQVEAQRVPRPGFTVPLHQPPADLATRRPYWTRQQLDTLPAAQASVKGRELAWLADPLDALLLQVQGSGRLVITEPNGTRRLVRVAYAGHNDLPYKSVGRWLVDQGELKVEQASWPAIRAWAKANPRRLNELLWSNPRVVFFREEALPDPQLGPKGAQAVPLTPGRSIAVDPLSVPYGTPVWLDTTEPLSSTPLRRIVMAQDTGSAITGAVRADYFWGWGDEAEAQAGRMKQPLRMWALWPRS